ncbi:hypothetical protein C1752_08254 [Acaryochloris thomasi RCC1774]|uniref:Uncharacterized protein n=1 Tax=Acaryochloris thomasi RCC1774 TaxID=1764569 RepID=A0A2W1JP84_9CYAN|nr:hypothetical protein [Acaryochloris thomasi]PZD71051.1 hypothetical protein C1752_08254 [Acaryochloris thomasi RCC1774]
MEIQDSKDPQKASLKGALREDQHFLVPYVSDREQADIEAEFGSPSDYETDAPIDMTSWVQK